MMEKEKLAQERENTDCEEHMFNFAMNMQYEMAKLFVKNHNENTPGPSNDDGAGPST